MALATVAGMPARRLLLLVVLAVGIGAAAARVASGGGEAGGDRPRPTLERLTVGTGAQAATVLHMRGAGPRPAVVFLHGWGLKGPRAYGPWLEHLARRGSTVIVPRYQASIRSSPAQALGNAVAGVRAAMDRVPIRREGLVVAGHSAGGAMAADLAASTGQLGLPVPEGIFIMYPGRAIRDFPEGIPEQDLTQVAPSTATVIVASAVDQVVGTGPAEQLHATLAADGISDLELLEVTDPVLGEHFAPARSSRPTRRYFWRILDRLVARVRA